MTDSRTRRTKAPIQYLQKTFHVKAESIKLQRQAKAVIAHGMILGEDKARTHYEHTLLRLTFKSWRDVCASEVDERKEWSLSVRANYHYKYHLYLKIWRAWQVYIVRKKVKKAKESVTLMQARYVILKRFFINWRGYCAECHLKQTIKNEARDFLDRKILQKCFVRWLNYLQLCRDNRRMATAAQQLWERTLTRKMLLEWKHFVILQKEKKLMACRTKQFYEKSLMSKCLYQGFLMYVLHRRDRLEAKALASQVYMDRLQSRTFQHWKRRLAIHQHILQKQEEIEALGRRSKLKRIMGHWKYYVKLCYNDRQNMRMAALHHQRSLTQMAFSSLQLRVVFRRVKVLRSEHASVFHNRQALIHAWTGWMKKIEAREEKEMFEETKKAREHHRLLSLMKVMAAWKQYLTWRQHRKSDYTMADAHHRQVLCHIALCALAANVQDQEVKRQITDQSNQFCRYHVINAVFYQWKEQYHLSLERRSMERMAILHDVKESLRRAFQMWRYRTEGVLSRRDSMITAHRYFNHHLCHQYFRHWRDFVKASKERDVQDWKAKVHYNTRILQRVWTPWRRDTLKQRKKVRLTERADCHYNLKILHLTMTHWKMYCDEQKGKLAISETIYNRIMNQRMRLAFEMWKSNVLECKKERQWDEAAAGHCHSLMVSRIFCAWHRYTLNRAVQVQKRAHQLTEASKRLNQGKLRQYFCVWQQKRIHQTTYRAVHVKAAEHHNKKIKKYVFKKWKEFKHIQTRKMILRQQSTWLNTTRLEAKFLLQWKMQYNHSLRERTETNIALWHWSLVLQGKVLAVWRNYVITRQEKKKRLEGAMVLRHQRLLETGLRRWIVTSDELSQTRVKYLLEQQSKVASRTFLMVRRCALHWRQKTLTNRTQEGKRTKERMPDSWMEDSFQLPSSSFLRARPKRPDFLRSSLQSAGLWDSVDECLSLPERREMVDEDGASVKQPRGSYGEASVKQPRGSYGEVDDTILHCKSPDMSSQSHDQTPDPFQYHKDLISTKLNTLGEEKLRDDLRDTQEGQKQVPLLSQPTIGLRTTKLLPPSAFMGDPQETGTRVAEMVPLKVTWSSRIQEIPSEEASESQTEDEEFVSDVRRHKMQMTLHAVVPPEMVKVDGDEDGDTGDMAVTTKDKLVELRTLLLGYQKLKGQVNLLEDQRKVLMFLIEEPGEETREEYELVQEDIKTSSQHLAAVKIQISSLMAEIGLQSSS